MINQWTITVAGKRGMHQSILRYSLIVCCLFLFELPMAKAGAQTMENSPAPSQSPDMIGPDEPVARDFDVAFPEAESEATEADNNPALATGLFWEPSIAQAVVFSPLKEVVAPSMMMLSNGDRLTDPENCGVGRSPCLLVFGDMESEFYAIKQRTFARHAQGPLSGSDFGDRGVKNMLAANFLSQRVLNRPYILQLGETGVDYWIIPKCGTYVRFKKRIPVQQFPDHAEPVQLKC